MDRTEAEFQTAVESLSRIRAVESPPDEKGERTIWHRGSTGVELISWVQRDGTLSVQNLNVWDQAVTWKRGAGVSTATIASEARGGVVVVDVQANAQLMKRVSTALAAYVGEDKFINHFKQILASGELPEMARRITREAEAFKPPVPFKSVMPIPPVAEVKPVKNAMLILIAIMLAIVGLGVGIAAIFLTVPR